LKKRFNIGETHLEHNTIVYPVPHLQHNKYLYRGSNPHNNLQMQMQMPMQNHQVYNPQMQQNNLSKSLVLNGNKIMQ